VGELILSPIEGDEAHSCIYILYNENTVAEDVSPRLKCISPNLVNRAMRIIGLSPIVAALVLILISVALNVMVYVVLLPSLNIHVGYSIPTRAIEKIKIDSVKLQIDSSFVIVVRNVGEVTCELDTIYLIDSVTDSMIARLESFIINGQEFDKYTINIRSVIEVTENFGITLTKNKVYKVKVLTTNGIEGSYKVVVKND